VKAALRFFIIVGTLSAVIVMALYYGHFAGKVQQPYKFSAFLDDVDNGRVREVDIRKNEIRVTQIDGYQYKTFSPSGYNSYNLVNDLRKKGIVIGSENTETSPWFSWVINGLVAVVVIGLMWLLFMRQMQVGGNKALSFGKSRPSAMLPALMKHAKNYRKLLIS
jgi:cell division protease FtsH